MRITIVLLLIGAAHATSRYRLERRLDQGGNGKVHISHIGEREIVVKCGPSKRMERYREEFGLMEQLRGESWAIQPIEFFVQGDSPCIVMESLNRDFGDVRRHTEHVWPLETVASIGLGLVEALKTLHFRHHLFHKDMHSGNIGTRKSDPSQLVIFDYGDMGPITHPAEPSGDLRQALLSLRYYWDGNRKFYVAKRYSYDKAEVCAGIPPSLCHAIDFAYTLKPKAATPDHYDELRAMLRRVLAETGHHEYKGRIIGGAELFGAEV